MNNSKMRIRPAGESSDEDEYADYLSDDEKIIPIRKVTQVINVEERENDKNFQLFMNGDLTEITKLLNGGFDVNKRLRDDWTPLMLAASVGESDITEILIERGADVNLHRDYYTPLMAAASCPETTSSYEKSLSVVKQLINHNVDIKAKTRRRITALMFAASNGNYDIVKELLPHSDKLVEDNQGWTALFWAVSGNHLEIVNLLLEEGLPCNKFDVRSNLPMHYALENDYVDIVDVLPSLKDQEKIFVLNEDGYQDFFINGSSAFMQDVATMLYGMKNEKHLEKFINNEIDLYKFLTLTEDDLIKMGVKMPYERHRILSGLHRFHIHPYKTKALPIVGKSEPYSTLNIANSILSSCRQFIAMKASLRYIIENGDVDDIKNFNKELGNIRAILITISNVINKVNLRAVEWDYDIYPADLITKDSCKNLRSSKLKYCCYLGLFSVVAYGIWKKYN